MASIIECIWNFFGASEKMTDLWANVDEKDRKRVESFWKEIWKPKDDVHLREVKLCNIVLGKEETTSCVSQFCMFNRNGSFDLIYENQNPFHLFTPKGSFSASFPMLISGLHAKYCYSHPATEDLQDELELQYVGLEHWLLKLKIPLSQTRTPTVTIGVTPQWHAFSVPCEIAVKGNLDAEHTTVSVAKWSVGVRREAPSFSFALEISKNTDAPSLKLKKVEATASCDVKTPRLSASVSWNINDLDCSFEHNDGSLSYISKAKLNFSDAKESVCSVGLGKKLDKDRGIQVALDTRSITSITYSHRVEKKFALNVSAIVDPRDINCSRLKGSFAFL